MKIRNKVGVSIRPMKIVPRLSIGRYILFLVSLALALYHSIIQIIFSFLVSFPADPKLHNNLSFFPRSLSH